MADEPFKDRHRTEKRYFSRQRLLSFKVVLLVILQKSAKSMQVVLNEVMKQLDRPLVSSSAFTQARCHLKHTAFIELNQKAVVEIYYQDDEYRRWQGHRLLGVDGSKVYLPRTAAIIEAFGGTAKNQHSAEVYPFGQVSVLYDVLNRIALDSCLGAGKRNEVELAEDHLSHTQPGDLLVFDRNYPGFVWLAKLHQRHLDYVGRCSKVSFGPVRQMFAGEGPDSQQVTIRVADQHKALVKQLGLSAELQVRLVRVWLTTGEMEILITSLLDEQAYPTDLFGDLYFHRWGCETYYDLLKTRLQLENFTGQTVEAVKQDFYATVYLTGLETILTEAAQDHLQAKGQTNRYPQQVNQAVSFNEIKHQIFTLFETETDLEVLLDKMTAVFLMKPHCIRKNRSVPRPKPSVARSLNFYKYSKKFHF